jgi:hypothetical protein
MIRYQIMALEGFSKLLTSWIDINYSLCKLWFLHPPCSLEDFVRKYSDIYKRML